MSESNNPEPSELGSTGHHRLSAFLSVRPSVSPRGPTCGLLIEAGEGVADDVLRVGAVQLLPEHGEEHGEVDGAGRLVHHGLQVVLCRVLTFGEIKWIKQEL